MGDWDTMDQRGCVMKFVVAEERFPRMQRLFPWWIESEPSAYGRREFPVPVLFEDRRKLSCFSAKMTNDMSDPAFQIAKSEDHGAGGKPQRGKR